MTGKLPSSASIVTTTSDVKLHAPSAARNADAICAMLIKYAPNSGSALEIASGTGQHVTTFATALPDLHWQPTEIDPSRRASIDAYVAEMGLRNVAASIPLDATAPGWGATHGPRNLILLVNLLHLISSTATTTLISEATSALAPGGTLILYGPFKRSGVLISEGDANFDADLKSADPNIGYKDDLDIIRMLSDAGLTLDHTVAMPANNLAFVARKHLP
ncbi:MAG: DUF938 domain-containing protein [Sulfitobacter sp.]